MTVYFSLLSAHQLDVDFLERVSSKPSQVMVSYITTYTYVRACVIVIGMHTCEGGFAIIMLLLL